MEPYLFFLTWLVAAGTGFWALLRPRYPRTGNHRITPVQMIAPPPAPMRCSTFAANHKLDY